MSTAHVVSYGANFRNFVQTPAGLQTTVAGVAGHAGHQLDKAPARSTWRGGSPATTASAVQALRCSPASARHVTRHRQSGQHRHQKQQLRASQVAGHAGHQLDQVQTTRPGAADHRQRHIGRAGVELLANFSTPRPTAPPVRPAPAPHAVDRAATGGRPCRPAPAPEVTGQDIAGGWPRRPPVRPSAAHATWRSGSRATTHRPCRRRTSGQLQHATAHGATSHASIGTRTNRSGRRRRPATMATSSTRCSPLALARRITGHDTPAMHGTRRQRSELSRKFAGYRPPV